MYPVWISIYISCIKYNFFIGYGVQTQDVVVFPLGALTFEKAMDTIQSFNKLLEKKIGDKVVDKSIVLARGDCGCIRVLLPAVDDAVKVSHWTWKISSDVMNILLVCHKNLIICRTMLLFVLSIYTWIIEITNIMTRYQVTIAFSCLSSFLLLFPYIIH